MSIDHKKSVVTDFRVDGQRFSGRIIEPAIVEHSPTGARSSSTVPATLKQSVPKSTVLSNLLKNARRGGAAIAARSGGAIVGGPVGAAIVAGSAVYDAYNLVAPSLAGEGYVYDDKYGDFVSEDLNVYCVATSGLCTDQKAKETVMNYRAVYADMKKPTPEMFKERLCKQLEREHFGFDRGVKVSKRDYRWVKDGNYCEVDFTMIEDYGFARAGSVVTHRTREVEFVPKTKEPISQNKFNEIIGPNADARPTQHVYGSRNDDGTIPGLQEDSVSVQDGSVVVIGPVTTTDNNVVQITINFSTTSGGQTTATVTVLPRPDLTPNSPTAPNVSSNTGGDTGNQTGGNTGNNAGNQTGGNTGNNAGNQTGGNTDNTDRTTRTELKPKTETGEGGQNDTETKPKEGDKTEQSQRDLLCDVFPKISACQELGDVDYEDLEIPEQVIDFNLSPLDAFQNNGTCPASKTFDLGMLGSFEVSYEHACLVASLIRPILILITMLGCFSFAYAAVREI